MDAIQLGWPTWECGPDRRTWATPDRSPFELEGGKLQLAARIDMWRGRDEDDIQNDEWKAILKHLPSYKAWSMTTYGWTADMAIPDVSWGNCMEKIVGLAYTVSRNQRNLEAGGGRLEFVSEQASQAWGATWPLWERLGFTPWPAEHFLKKKVFLAYVAAYKNAWPAEHFLK